MSWERSLRARYLLAYLAGRPLAAFGMDHVEAYLVDKIERKSARTAAVRYRSIVSETVVWPIQTDSRFGFTPPPRSSATRRCAAGSWNRVSGGRPARTTADLNSCR